MTILNESGTPDVLSPLYCVGSLGETLERTLFVVVGTQSEAHATQELLDTLAPANPRTLYLTLEAEKPEPGALASQLSRAARKTDRLPMDGRSPDLCLMFVSRSARLIGVDAAAEARLTERRLGYPVRSIEVGVGGFTTSTEDSAARILLGLCPVESPREEERPARKGLLGGLWRRREESPPGAARQRPVVLLGSVSRECRGELAGELERVGVEVAGFVPEASPQGLPPLTEETVLAPVQPYMVEATRAAEERGLEVVRTLFPIGVDGTARFVREVARAAGHEVNELARAREWLREFEGLRNRLRGIRIFLTGDTGLEVPLARALAGAGAVIVEVGTPRLNRSMLVSELQTLGSEVDIVEAPEWTRQIERIEESRPDLVIASPGLYAPLTARGHLCRLSLDFLREDVYGYPGARRLLELLVRPLDRADRLAALEL